MAHRELILNYIITILFIIICLIVYIIYNYIDYRKQRIKLEKKINYMLVESTKEIKVPEKTFNPKKIEAVCVCVNYSDFLRYTLPFNKNHFDKMVIVTTEADTATRALCEYWHVECVTTDEFYNNGDSFNKGRGINEGLKALDGDGWVLHIDSDIYLPPRTREILQTLDLDEKALYSIDRVNCKSFTEWLLYFEKPNGSFHTNGLYEMKEFESGARLVNLGRDGYIPIGFFQLWHPNKTGVKSYPVNHSCADRSDVLFSYNWKRNKRLFIPEIIGIHLESSSDEMGVNWKGRKSKIFGLS